VGFRLGAQNWSGSVHIFSFLASQFPLFMQAGEEPSKDGIRVYGGVLMRSTYVFCFYSHEDHLIRMSTKPCANLHEAMHFAVADCTDCARIQISMGSRIVWSGSLEQVKAA
jgi:hypothetical protein